MALSYLAIDLAVGLAIGGVKSIGGNITINFSGWSLWKLLIIL